MRKQTVASRSTDENKWEISKVKLHVRSQLREIKSIYEQFKDNHYNKEYTTRNVGKKVFRKVMETTWKFIRDSRWFCLKEIEENLYDCLLLKNSRYLNLSFIIIYRLFSTFPCISNVNLVHVKVEIERDDEIFFFTLISQCRLVDWTLSDHLSMINATCRKNEFVFI